MTFTQIFCAYRISWFFLLIFRFICLVDGRFWARITQCASYCSFHHETAVWLINNDVQFGEHLSYVQVIISTYKVLIYAELSAVYDDVKYAQINTLHDVLIECDLFMGCKLLTHPVHCTSYCVSNDSRNNDVQMSHRMYYETGLLLLIYNCFVDCVPVWWFGSGGRYLYLTAFIVVRQQCKVHCALSLMMHHRQFVIWCFFSYLEAQVALTRSVTHCVRKKVAPYNFCQ